MTSRCARLLLILCFCASSVRLSASELSESMQLVYSAEYQGAHDALTKMLDKGHMDARVHYFRGLASYHLGDLDGADKDFQRGAELEGKGAGQGVGQALQRIQGRDRLRLERHRTMARLAARHRVQPLAPQPIVSLPIAVETAPAVAGYRSTAGVRLASEVPMVPTGFGDEVDPFVDDPSSSLAGDLVPFSPSQEERPVGTGVASDVTNAQQPTSAETDLADDPFADIGGEQAPVAESQPSTRKSKGIMGAVFRALGRSMPINPSVLRGGQDLPIPGIPGGQPPQAAEETTAEAFDFDSVDTADDGADGDDPFSF